MKTKLSIYSQSNYLSRTAIEAVHAVRQSRTSRQILFAVCISKKQALTGEKSLACEDKCSKKIGAVLVQQAYRRSFEASAVLHQKPYILVQFLIISFAYAKLIRLKSPPSVAERNCKNKIEQSGKRKLLLNKSILSEVFSLTIGSGKTMAFENRHVGCKEREKINRRCTLCTLRINFFEATQQTACIFSKEMTHTENHGDNDEQREKRYYYHSDHLGSAQFVTDWRGKQYEHIEYTPYGKLWTYKSKTAKLFLTTYNNFLAKQPVGLIEETAPGIDSYCSGLRERSLMKRRGFTIMGRDTLTRSIVGG